MVFLPHSCVLALSLLAPLSAAKEQQSQGQNPAEVTHLRFHEQSSADGERKLFQGDMLLTPQQWHALWERKGLKDVTFRWQEDPAGFPVVPYKFEIKHKYEGLIKKAMTYWSKVTCLKFRKADKSDKQYVRISDMQEDGCSSSVGRLPDSENNTLSIAEGCGHLHVIIHELGHTIGFEHEQSRPDRDDYITINMDNIEKENQHNFDMNNEVYYYDIPYDYTSIMHYTSRMFSINGLTTIDTKDPKLQGLLGQHYALSSLSHRDLVLANKMYNCTDKWVFECWMDSDPCQNEGYFGPKCTCVCRPGTEGDLCQTVIKGYYEVGLQNSCSKEITEEGVITSPGYPNGSNKGVQCVFTIMAPEGKSVGVNFTDFKLYKKTNDCAGNNICCYYDSLEVRIDGTARASYCGEELMYSRFDANQTILLLFSTKMEFDDGWSAQVEFYED